MGCLHILGKQSNMDRNNMRYVEVTGSNRHSLYIMEVVQYQCSRNRSNAIEMHTIEENSIKHRKTIELLLPIISSLLPHYYHYYTLFG